MIKKFDKYKVSLSFKDTIRGAGLADMKLKKTAIKEFDC